MKVLIPEQNITVQDPFSGERRMLQKKKVYILSEVMFAPFMNWCYNKKIKPNKLMKYADVNDFFDVLNYNKDKDIYKVIIIRTGGIGDLIALSAISSFLYHNGIKKINYITQYKYMDLFKYFPEYIKGYSFFSPVMDKKEKYTHNIKIIYFEGIIENSKKNWYELQFNRINATFDEKQGRPALYNNNRNKLFNDDKFRILVNLKASSPVRSSKLTKEFLDIVENQISKKTNNYEIILLERNLNKYEVREIDEYNSNKINVVETKSLIEFLDLAYSVDFNISVDTALIHFSEGLGIPGLGIYSSFPVEARNKYYIYTKNIDFISKCPYQPCFIHTRRPGETCPITVEEFSNGNFDDQDLLVAPCLNNKYNKNFYDDLAKTFESITL